MEQAKLPGAEKVKKLTPKERRFCEEYIIDMNASRAARDAGYSEKTARAIGYENLTKPYIREYINQLLNEKSLKAEEVRKLTADIAKSSLNEFFTIRQVEHTPRMIKPLADIVKEIEAEIKFEDEYATLAGFSEDELKEHETSQKYRRRTIIKYNLELKNCPDAKRIVNGETIFIDQAELDMVKLIKAKESGRIKSISYTPSGIPKVEMYAADAALVSLARMHGLYIDKTELTGKDGQPLKPQIMIIGGKEITF